MPTAKTKPRREAIDHRIEPDVPGPTGGASEATLLDRTTFTVSPEAYADFLARLDAPPRPNERLRRTMQTTPPWE
jgi:hypothetical protein